MVVPLPHKTLTDYHRDFELGILEKFCPGTCPICGAPINLFGYRLRKILNLHLLRGRCCGLHVHYFTFLPLFVAPAKWYGYETIEKALVFMNQKEFVSGTAALEAWEIARETRIENQEIPGPCSKTVHRWQKELGQKHPDRPWAKRASQVTVKAFGRAIPEGVGRLAFTAILLATLQFLGEALLGSTNHQRPASSLGIGIWYLESRFQQRCLARFELAGHVVPGPVPDSSGNAFFLWGYSPKPPPPS